MTVVSRPIAAWLAVSVAALAVAITVRWNTFTPWGTDAAAYIEEAHRWEAGELFTPSPLQFWSPWRPIDLLLAPLGFRPGAVRGTEVGEYPLGLPLLMAAAIRLGGPLAAYLVVPVSVGLLVWCAYLLGSYLAGHWAGLIASVVVAASPITLILGVQPMSDVPAAALWALSWVMSVRPRLGAAAASGAAAAAAIMVRPNLAPLAIVIAGLMISHRDATSARWGRLKLVVTFSMVAVIGPFMVGWSHDVLYGSPFRSGYLAQENFFRLAHVSANLTLYPRLLMQAHTPLIFSGLVAACFLWWSPVRARLDTRARRVAWSAIGLAVVNYLLYLPYLPLPDRGVVRFVLPAFAALVVLLAGLLVHVSRAVTSRSRLLSALCVVPAAIVVAYPSSFVSYAMILHGDQAQVRIAGLYLNAVLPPNAAILTGIQSAGLAHFTKRLIVRLDAIHPTALDSVVAEIERRGYRPILVLESETEAAWFRAHFSTSPLRLLDWPPRARFLNRITYWDFADRDAYARGHRWPTDALSLR